MGRILVILVWFVLLAAAIIYGLKVWLSLEDVEMSPAGVNALIAGVVLSLIIGFGLMALVFYSARSGHDEKADNLLDSPKSKDDLE